MGISDKIEAFITELMKNDSDYAEFGRNELAGLFGCVPSQINYVISTRFSPEKGYCVESRRGGGGYIKIRRIHPDGADDVIAGISGGCSEKEAHDVIEQLYGSGFLERQAAKVLLATCSDSTLACAADKDKLRSDIIKNAVMSI